MTEPDSIQKVIADLDDVAKSLNGASVTRATAASWILALNKRLSALAHGAAEDAARYRWIRQRCFVDKWGNVQLLGNMDQQSDLVDRNIDTARAENANG